MHKNINGKFKILLWLPSGCTLGGSHDDSGSEFGQCAGTSYLDYVVSLLE